jgi:hypothetical protein
MIICWEKARREYEIKRYEPAQNPRELRKQIPEKSIEEMELSQGGARAHQQ